MQQKIILKEQMNYEDNKKRQLANLQKQAEEATKYKSISEEIKKIEAGLILFKTIRN